MDIPRRQQQFYCIKSETYGAFFEFPENDRKGHRFFIGVSRKLSIKFEPVILEQLLQDVRLFCFVDWLIANIKTVKDPLQEEYEHINAESDEKSVVRTNGSTDSLRISETVSIPFVN